MAMTSPIFFQKKRHRLYSFACGWHYSCLFFWLSLWIYYI